MNVRRKRRIRLLCLALVSALLAVTLAGCTGGAAVKIRLSSQEAYVPESAGDAFHLVSESALERMESTDELSLYFDKNNAGIAVKNANGELLCASLGAFADSCGLSAVFNMTVRGEDGRLYHLNAQDNCAVFGAFRAVKTEAGFSVNYSLALSKEDALISVEALPKGVLRADVTLLFTLDGGALCLSCDCASLYVSEGYTVVSLMLLPGLASDIPSKGGFYLLPDGCGAYADVSGKAPKDISYTYSYGGTDVTAGGMGTAASLPAFAFGNAAMSVCVTAESGEALLSIAYWRTAGETGGAVYPAFTLAASEEKDGNVYLGPSYGGSLSLRYTFLGAGRGFADLSTVCRERLVRRAILPAGTLTAASNTPFLLTAVGALNSKSSTSYTQFSEAKEMLTILKAKGIDNLALRYVGTLTGGLLQEDITDAKPLRSLGGNDEIEALTDYARVQGLEVFFEANLLSSDKSGAMRTLTGDKAVITPFPEAYTPFLKENDMQYALPLEQLDDRIEAALSLFSGQNVSLGDVCGFLYGDPGTGYTRQESMEIIKKACRAFSAQGNVMLSAPALYLLEGADYVDGLPMDTITAHEENITAVPFLQTVLHGTVYYAGTPLNFSGDLNFAILKCIEYGCLPSAVLTYRTVNTGFDTYYASLSQELADAYERMDATLWDLYDKRITGYTKVQKDVYCTEYANTTLVYVNYSDKNVEVSGLTLAPMDYMRVN